MRLNEDGHVFPSQGTTRATATPHRATLQKAMRRLRQRAGIADFALHDIRRSVASHMAALGVDRLVISKLLGHAEAGITGRVYERYDRHAEMRQAVERWARQLDAIRSGEQPAKVVPLRA